jgi:AraC-like DNA-binding protein
MATLLCPGSQNLAEFGGTLVLYPGEQSVLIRERVRFGHVMMPDCSDCEEIRLIEIMKADRSYQQHLVIHELILGPGGEWAQRAPGWMFVHVTSGVGYWLHPRTNHELPAGASLVLSDQAQGCFRVSQIGAAVLHYFNVKPERLTGLITLGDQHVLQNAARQDRSALRVIPQTDPLCQRFRQLNENRNGNNFPLRLQLLDIFIRTFGDELINHNQEAPDTDDAKVRLTKLLQSQSVDELLEMNLVELAEQMRCTPRHLSRTFHQVVGMSFRDKQAELRLIRAQELLATTQSKVLEVALESGYQSVSLFNLMFKRRFGVSPGKWRERLKTCKPCRRPANRLQFVRA